MLKITLCVKYLVLIVFLALSTPATYLSTPLGAQPLRETSEPDAQLARLAKLILEKRMDEFFKLLTLLANLDHETKNYDKASIQKLGENLKSLFGEGEQIIYVDKVVDEKHGYSLRKVVYMAYTSSDRWVYFTFVLKRGAQAWQFTRFSYSIDPIKLFPDKK